jgi:protein-disulfide isomerase
MRKRIGTWCVWLVVGTGLLVSGLAGVEQLAPALWSLCLGQSSACRETAQFVLFGMPVWAWGAVYYVSLGVALAFAPQWLPLLVGAGLGMELDLAWIMLSQQLACTICLANLVVVLILALLTLTWEKFWPTATVCLLALLTAQAAVVRGVPAPGAAVRQENPVVAWIGGTAITENELETALSERLSDLKDQIFRLKQDQLGGMVREKVLAREAAARGVDVEELLHKEVDPRTAPVTDAEVKAMVEENRRDLARFNWSEEELRRRIRDYLARKKADEAVRVFAESLYPKYGVRILLAEPKAATLPVDPGDGPSLGPADALVTVVEFSDYQCPACRRGHATVKAMREKYRDRVRWVFRDYPLAMHENARPAAEAARCAREQGKFWEYQDKLYAAPELTREHFLQMAGELGMDRERFAQCLDAGKYAEGVASDLAEAHRIGLDGTPAYVVNGRLVSGTPKPEKFSAIIDEALAAAAPAKR